MTRMWNKSLRFGICLTAILISHPLPTLAQSMTESEVMNALSQAQLNMRAADNVRANLDYRIQMEMDKPQVDHVHIADLNYKMRENNSLLDRAKEDVNRYRALANFYQNNRQKIGEKRYREEREKHRASQNQDIGSTVNRTLFDIERTALDVKGSIYDAVDEVKRVVADPFGFDKAMRDFDNDGDTRSGKNHFPNKWTSLPQTESFDDTPIAKSIKVYETGGVQYMRAQDVSPWMNQRLSDNGMKELSHSEPPNAYTDYDPFGRNLIQQFNGSSPEVNDNGGSDPVYLQGDSGSQGGTDEYAQPYETVNANPSYGSARPGWVEPRERSFPQPGWDELKPREGPSPGWDEVKPREGPRGWQELRGDDSYDTSAGAPDDDVQPQDPYQAHQNPQQAYADPGGSDPAWNSGSGGGGSGVSGGREDLGGVSADIRPVLTEKTGMADLRNKIQKLKVR